MVAESWTLVQATHGGGEAGGLGSEGGDGGGVGGDGGSAVQQCMLVQPPPLHSTGSPTQPLRQHAPEPQKAHGYRASLEHPEDQHSLPSLSNDPSDSWRAENK